MLSSHPAAALVEVSEEVDADVVRDWSSQEEEVRACIADLKAVEDGRH